MEPFVFSARAGEKPFKVQIDLKQGMVVTGIVKEDYYWRFTKPVPVKKGDEFEAAPGRGLVVRGSIFNSAPFRGLLVNGKTVERNFVSPKRKMGVRISWVAKRLRVVVYRDRVWRPGKPTHGKVTKTSWVAVDVRSYHVGQGSAPHEAIKSLLWTCAASNFMADEERGKGRQVIRWRCLLSKREASEMEAKAKKDGLILDGVEVPEFRKLA